MSTSPQIRCSAAPRIRRSVLWKTGLGMASALACACFAGSAAAQTTYYWDGNGTTTGAGTNAQVTGTWGTSVDWNTDPTGGAAGTINATGPGVNDTAVFTAFDNVPANNPTGNYTVTLGAAQSVSGIIIGPTTYNATYANNDGTPTIATSTYTLTIGAGGVTLNGSSGDPGFTGSLILGADQTWTINNAHVINPTAAIAGNATAGNTRTWTLGNVGAYNPTFSGVISDGTAGGNLGLTINNIASAVTTPTGGNGGYSGGTWTINGKVNTYTGQTTIARGNLQINTLANLGVASSLGAPTTAANGAIAMGSGTYYGTLTVNNSSAAMTTNRGINLAGTTGGGEIYNNNGTAAYTVTITGDLTNTGAGAKTFGLRGTNTGSNVFGGALVDSSAGGALTVSKYDAGQWTLSSANNTFTGGLTVAAGTLNLTNTSVFSGGITLTGGTLAVSAAGNLGSNVTGNSISIQGGNLLLGADTNVGNNQSITINAAGGGVGVSATPGTAFPAVTAAAGAPIVFGLNYTGTGGIGATGGANGTTDVPGIDALFTPTSATFLGAFAAGTGTGTYTGTTLPVGAGNNYRVGGGGGTIMFQNSVFTGANNLLAGTTGGGTVILPNANTYTGTTTVQNGTLTATSLNSVVGGTGSSSLGAPTTAANGTITIGSGTNIAGLNYTGGGTTTDRIVNIAGSGGTSILSNGGTGPVVFSSAPTFTQTATKTFQLGLATDTFGGTIGAITDATGTVKTNLTKLGLTNSTWNIGTSTYTGTTTINGGVLSSPTVLPNSTLITLAGSGTTNLGILQTNGTIARTLSTSAGLNWQTNGGFAAFGGKLTVTANGNAAISYGTAGFFPNNGTMSFGSTSANNQVEFTNAINLAANDGFQRAIYVEQGVGGDSALLSGTLSQPTVTGANPGIVKQGKGTLILSGANIFSGTVTVSAGSLVAGNNSMGTTSGAFGTGTGPVGGTSTTQQTVVVGDGNTGAGGNPSVQIGGAFTVDRPMAFSDSGTNNTYSVGGTTDANSTFSGQITVSTGNTPANNNTFSVTQVATTGTNALNITGGIVGGTNTARTITFNDTGAVNVSSTGIINGGTGALSVTKINSGILTLSAFNIYSGPTLVNGGTLLVDGVTIAASAFTVGNGTNLTGTLGGAGTINGAVTLNAGSRITGGTLGGVNTLSLGSTLTLNSGSIYQLDIVTGTNSDLLAITGAFLSNGATVNVNSGTLNGTSTYTIATYASDTGSTFVLTNAPGYQLFDSGTTLQLIPAPAPEPSTWAITALFAGLGAATVVRRRQNAWQKSPSTEWGQTGVSRHF